MVLCLCEFLQKVTRRHKREHTCTCTHSWTTVPLFIPNPLWFAWKLMAAPVMPREGGEVSGRRSTLFFFFFPFSCWQTNTLFHVRKTVYYIPFRSSNCPPNTHTHTHTHTLHPSSSSPPPHSTHLWHNVRALQLRAIRTSLDENSRSLRRSRDSECDGLRQVGGY